MDGARGPQRAEPRPGKRRRPARAWSGPLSAHDLALPLFGLLTGLSLAALGSGGSILALPAFVFAAGVAVKSSVATSLAVVGATSLYGALMAYRRCRTCGCPGQEVDG